MQFLAIVIICYSHSHISALNLCYHTFRTLVDKLHANTMGPVRLDLQIKVINAFVQQDTRAPFVRKETVGKKLFIDKIL